MFNISQVELERLRFGLQTRLDAELLSANVRCAEDILTQSVIFEVRGSIWAEKKSAQVFSFEYPADWWQAFKSRWFPSWAKRRWPVEMQKIKVDVKAIYPDYRPALPDREYRLMIHKVDFDPMRDNTGYVY